MLTLAILAGGKSQRMGRDKASLPFQGATLLRYLIDRLNGLADETILITPGSDVNLGGNIKIVPDLLPDRGPLGGLYTALYYGSQQAVAVVACDMPFASAKLLKYQCEILLSENVDAVVPSSYEGLEPLHSVYRRDVCLPIIKRTIDDGEWRLISWFSQINLRVLSSTEITSIVPTEKAFFNVNTPEDLKKAEKMAKEEKQKRTYFGNRKN